MNPSYLKKLGFELVQNYDNFYVTDRSNFKTAYSLTILNKKRKKIILCSSRGAEYSGIIKNRKDFESLLKIMGYES